MPSACFDRLTTRMPETASYIPVPPDRASLRACVSYEHSRSVPARRVLTARVPGGR
ncbi:hypothetical protein CGRA01v4_03554 [Colletotrichum graminicola]|nr:hypothetical protein CGRA01v4_03554 [Colletotrichum graminicola]